MDTLAPVVQKAPDNELIFPFNQRYVMRGWKLLFVPGSQFNPDTTKSESWNNGAYLVEGLAHCGECHTPRGLMFQRIQSKALSGGELEGWTAWNITQDAATGIGSWSDEQIADYLSKGYAHGRGPAAGGMRQAIDLSFSRLPASDIRDIVGYLRTVSPLASSYQSKSQIQGGVTASENSKPWSPEETANGLGKQLFEGACASCHGWDGSGQNTARAALAGSHSVNDPTGANLIRVILQGTSDSTGSATTAMPSFAHAYSDVEIAALSNYVISHFGGKRGAVTPDLVGRAR